jgi:hypothetical protein
MYLVLFVEEVIQCLGEEKKMDMEMIDVQYWQFTHTLNSYAQF